MTFLRIARRPWWLAGALMLSLGFGSGCGQSAQPADASQARQALRTVLDAWKAGGLPGDLGSRTPSIYVKDLDWNDGYRLVSYKPSDEGKLAGYDMNYAVILELKSPKGKSVKKAAVYTITTRPECLVMRQEG